MATTKDMYICTTPTGDELVECAWLDEPTRILSAEEVKAILACAEHLNTLDRNPYARPTRREFKAVIPHPKKKA